jgi:GTP-binding protein
MNFTIAIVGRPNVGKSTLFNRIVGERKAIVDDISGVTRDRHYGTSEWNGKTFNLIDTGGFVPNSEDVFEAAIRRQVQIAVEESSLVLFIVDVTTGVTVLDEEMAAVLRKSKREVLLVVNKVDNGKRKLDASEFYGLGFKEYYTISAMSGSETGDLMDAIASHIPNQDIEELEEEIPKLAIVGQPNVGKSSLLNALTNQERNIVTDIAGTTRDSIHTRYNLFNKDVLLIDTAGLRKKEKVKENLEFYSTIRAINAVDEADICIIMIDARAGIEAQDLSIFRMAEFKKKGIIIAVNKWDLVADKGSNTMKEYEEAIHHRIAPFTDVPIIFISAIEKQRILRVIEAALEVYELRKQKISTSKLNEFLEKIIEKYPPPATKGKNVKINYITQLPIVTPTFAFFTNFPKYIREPYRNYIENRMRETFNFKGVPLRFVFRDKN